MIKRIYSAIAFSGVLLLMLTIFNSCIQEETFAKATVETSQVTSITEATATCGGILTADGGSDVTTRGVCWSTSPTPTIENDTTIVASGTSAFSSSIKGLSPGTTYYVRAYAVNKGGVAYGLNEIFTTKTFSITTTPISVSLLTATSAIGGGNIISDGDSSSLTVIARGVCWNTFPSPTIENSKTIDGVGGGRFTSNMDSLTAFTTYYVRAYATNGNGTIYGNEISFTTQSGVIGLTTATVSSITAFTATSGGAITSDGGAPVTVRGVCWSTSSYPTIANSKTTDGSGTDTFISNITGLTPGTTYFIRSYATNSVGTSYGNELSISSLNGVVGLTTTSATSISTISATCGGNISSDGGSAVISRGVCWNTSMEPTTANTKTANGSGLGTFTANITGLTPGTTYYIRSYAINSVSTNYGNEVSFTTQNGVIILTTNTTSFITAFTATSGGAISSNGGASITARGVCWNTSSEPTTANNKTANGSGSSTFTANITGLTPGTTYYIRSYATNSVGTSYGNEVSFTTQNGVIILTTNTTSFITALTASSGGAISSNGGATITASGVCWSISATPTTANSKTTDGATSGSFTSSLTGLISGTTYYVRAYATNSVGTTYGNQESFATTTSSGSVTDVEGNVYNYITIGARVWMVENLKTTKYNDGTSIPLVSDGTAWSNLSTPGYCFYNNDVANENRYGALYNWYTIYTGKLAPTGWHVPTDVEWAMLENYLIANGYNYDGTTTDDKIAKSMATTTGWLTSTITGAIGNDLTKNNTSGFAALPGGFRHGNGNFLTFGYSGYWWSSTEDGTPDAWNRALYNNDILLNRIARTKSYGYSVRCVRD